MEYNVKQLQIIEVGERLFAQKGFSGTSVRDIAQAADVNVSMISYYFGSKEKLIEALFNLRTEETRTRIENVIGNDELTALQKMNILVDNVIDKLFGNQCFHNIMMREQLSSSRTPVISDYIMTLKLRNAELLQKLIREGQESGQFKRDIDMSLTTTTLYGTVNHALATQEFYRKINNLESMPDEEFTIHLKQKLRTYLKNIIKSTFVNEPNVQS